MSTQRDTDTVAYDDAALRMCSFSLPERAALGVESVESWSLAVVLCVGLWSAFALERKR